MLTSSENALVFIPPALSLSPRAAVLCRITPSPPEWCVDRWVFYFCVRTCAFLFGSATLLAFLFELLKSSVAMQEQMLGGKGFLVIGYLLEKVSGASLTCCNGLPNSKQAAKSYS